MNDLTYILNSNSWTDFQSALTELSKNEKGDAFELLTKLYFKTDPVLSYYYDEVWLLSEVPQKELEYLGLPSHDLGIDLIAKHDKEYHPIQCKYHSDKSSSVILDKRAIVSPNTYFSVAQGDYANHAIAIGADQDDTTPVIGTKTNATEMAKFGRAGMAISIDSVTQQATIDDYAQTLLDVADHIHFIPASGSAFPIKGADVEDFNVGDTVTWIYDYGLGLIELQRDVYKRIIKVDKAGTESMTVEFL